MKIHINHLVWEVNIASTTDPELMVDGEMFSSKTFPGIAKAMAEQWG